MAAVAALKLADGLTATDLMKSRDAVYAAIDRVEGQEDFEKANGRVVSIPVDPVPLNRPTSSSATCG